MTEENISQIFVEKLIDQGYPPESIIQEYRVNKHMLDLVIIDIDTENIIAIFEFKSGQFIANRNKDIERLKEISKNLFEFPIQLHLVYTKEEFPYFELLYLTKEDGVEILVPIQIPPYNSLKALSTFLIKIKKKKKENKTYDIFKITCWSLAMLITILLGFDLFEIITITPERIGIIAIIIGLVVIPSAKKLNMLGLEFERLNLSDKKDK